MPKTKIICTLGPASESETVIRKMTLAGMDVVRLNFSHGSHKEHAERIEIVRRINRKYHRNVQILIDLEGQRVRIGHFKSPIPLKKRQKFWLTQAPCLGKTGGIPFDYHGSLEVIKAGYFIYIDDGNISLKVLEVKRKKLLAEVIVAGLLKERKGINIPQAHLPFVRLSEKDKEDINFGVKHSVDYIAQSFVRSKKDILEIKNFLKDRLPNAKIIAKIENQEGIKNIDEIIAVCEAIMIARGDMGVCLPIHEVPMIQKQIIFKCNQKKKPVITATQMLESMVENARPTRAEVTDVANAVLDGTNFVMLSAETAVGKHPVEAVKMMNQIIKFTEKSSFYRVRKNLKEITQMIKGDYL
jgi:pyruvate kinase